MILGIGVDSAEIQRFEHFRHYSLQSLNRLFSPPEIEYCLANKKLSAQRFAIRFAAREACFKALCQWYTPYIPFLSLCKKITIHKHANGAPTIFLHIPESNSVIIHPSFTHTRDTATAWIIMEQKSN